MTTQVDTTFLNLAGSKLRNRLGSQLNESSGSGVPAFAKAQLEKLGWKEGEGLGKRRQGMASHIKVVKRADGLGLGESTLDPAIHQSLAANDWWKNSVGDTLAKLAAAKSKTKKKKDKKNNNKEKEKETKTKVYTDEELFEATGGARFGMRAQTQQHAKWKRAESNISADDEEDAKQKVEWDGMSAPKVVLKERKMDRAAQKQETDEEKEERKRQKKEKKRRRKEEALSDETSKKSKKSKKQKVSSKD